MPKTFKKQRNIFGILVLILCLAISIMSAELFSGFITAGNFSAMYNKNVKSTEFTLYGIYSHKSLTEGEAQSLSGDVKAQGGAGFVLFYEGAYYVMLSAYEEESDANKVIKSLATNSNTSAFLLEITIDNIKISNSFKTESQTCIYNSVMIFKKAFLQLYDCAVSYDTKVSDVTTIKSSLSILLKEISECKNEFDGFFSKILTFNLIKVKLALASLYEIIEDFCENISANTNLSSSIKYAYFDVISLIINLEKEINNSY